MELSLEPESFQDILGR